MKLKDLWSKFNESAQSMAKKAVFYFEDNEHEKIQPIEPKIQWAIKARRAMGLHDENMLRAAIGEIKDIPEINDFLRAYGEPNMDALESLARSLPSKLNRQNRTEEALTVKLIRHNFSARLAEHFFTMPPDQRKIVWELVERSCRHALQIARALQDEACQAKYLALWGRGLSDIRQFNESESYYTESLRLYRRLAEREPQTYLVFVARILGDLGNTQHSLTKLDESERSISEALGLFRRLGASEPAKYLREMAGALGNLANVLEGKRSLAKAEECHSESIKLFRKLAENEPEEYTESLAITLNNFGNVQRELRKVAEAIESHKEALDYFRKMDGRKQRVLLGMAMALNNLGTAQMNQKKAVEAERSHTEALTYIRRLAADESGIFRHEIAVTLECLGSAQSSQGKTAEAQKSFKESMEIIRSLAAQERIYINDLARILGNAGNTHKRDDDLEGAEKCYTEALEIYQASKNPESQTTLRNISMTHYNLGGTWIKRDIDKAIGHFTEAREIVEQLLGNSMTFDEKAQTMQGFSYIYSGLLDCFLKKADWEKVLEIAEHGKSRSLTDLLNLKSDELRPKPPTPDHLSSKYADALKELERLERVDRQLSNQIIGSRRSGQVAENTGSGTGESRLSPEAELLIRTLSLQKEEIKEAKFGERKKLEETIGQVNQYDPDFPPKIPLITAEEIKEIAGKLNRTIVMFRVQEEGTAIIFVFPNREIHVEEVLGLDRDKLFEHYYKEWFLPYGESLNNTDESAHRWRSKIVDVLMWLDKVLLYKVREVLNSKTDLKSVMFIPNLSLALLPLHAACRFEKDQIVYFLEDYTVSYCPSVSVLRRCLKNEPVRTEGTLGIITPTEDLSFYTDRQMRMMKEFDAESDCLVNEDAVLSEVVKKLNEDYAYIHFYCHGTYDRANPFDSGLMMHNGEILDMSAIIKTNLKQNWLTVLSACETGMVDGFSSTDEHFGLPLGFVFAGSPSVWASLWSVSAVTTHDLMNYAYGNLKIKEFGNNKPEALRQAQMEMLLDKKGLSHPYYWAGFQHFGV